MRLVILIRIIFLYYLHGPWNYKSSKLTQTAEQSKRQPRKPWCGWGKKLENKFGDNNPRSWYSSDIGFRMSWYSSSSGISVCWVALERHSVIIVIVMSMRCLAPRSQVFFLDLVQDFYKNISDAKDLLSNFYSFYSRVQLQFWKAYQILNYENLNASHFVKMRLVFDLVSYLTFAWKRFSFSLRLFHAFYGDSQSWWFWFFEDYRIPPYCACT